MFDKKKFASYLDEHAHKKSTGYCATYVREALQAAGINTSSHPINAKDYGPYLERWGFRPVSNPGVPQIGDIAVIQPTAQGIKDYISPAGHIAAYDGRKWVSDFNQIDIWGGQFRKDHLPIMIYRQN